MIGEFRAWHNELKEYVHVHKYCVLQHNGIFSGDCALEQFTGLHDKNGVKIFEGDIVKTVEMWGGKRNQLSIVVFDHYQWVIDSDGIKSGLNKNNSFFHGQIHQAIGEYEGEVIGNIHQNPELLEK